MNLAILNKKGTFLAALAAIVGLSIGSLAFSQTITFGAETDVGGGGTPAASTEFPVVGGAPIGQPPAAPVNPGNSGAIGPGNSGAIGGDANALPSTGSGGYLDSSSSSLPYALVALAVAVALTGSMAWVHSRK